MEGVYEKVSLKKLEVSTVENKILVTFSGEQRIALVNNFIS